MKNNFFSDSITLDPSASLAAWQKLGSSTWPYEVANLPAIFHHTLRRRLKEEEIKWQTIQKAPRKPAQE